MKILDLDRQQNFHYWRQFAKNSMIFWGLILATQFVFRTVMFFMFKGNNMEDDFYSYIFDSFLMGARFDFGVANYLLVIPLLLSYLLILLRSSKLWSLFLRGFKLYCYVGLSLTSFLALCNLTFYHYFTDHFNLLVFGLWEDDTVALVKSLWENEPVVKEFFLLAIIFYLFWKLINWSHKSLSYRKEVSFKKRSFVLVIGFFVVGFGARGTLNLNMHPLHRMHTEVSPYHFLNQLSFSPIYALGDAMILGAKVRKDSYDLVEAMGYKNNIKQAYADLLDKPVSEIPDKPEDLLVYTSPKRKTKQPHVIVVAMESMGSFWLKFHSENYPILGKMEKHIAQDVFSTKFLPSGSGTYPSITHWLLNMPTLPGPAPAEVFVNKDFMTSAVKPFNQAGYTTHYVYGGGLGWRNLSPFLLGIGFNELHGETRIKKELGENIPSHPWGVFDEDLFKYVQNQIEKAEKPQMFFVLTTTNHPPFEIPKNAPSPAFNYPEELSKRMTKNSKTLQQRLAAYRYSMDALGGFMDWVKSRDEEFVVAASGDHSFYESVQFYPSDIVEWWGVPLYMYSSHNKLPKIKWEDTYSAHSSIFPTIYDLSLNEVKYLATTPSLLRKGNHFAASNMGFVNKLGHTSGDKFYKWRIGEPAESFSGSFSEEMKKLIRKRRAYFAVSSDLIKKSPNKGKNKQ